MPTQNIFDLVDTWASGGGPYTSIKMNATDNDVGSASLLMDLQVGTVSKFSVSKAGSATFGGSITATASGSYVNAAGLSLGTGGAGGIFVSGGNAFTVNSSGGFRWSSNANVNVDTNGDLILTRRAAANLRLGAADTTGTTAPTPQFLSAQSWSSSTTFDQLGANFTINGSQGTGTGAGGSIIFQVAPAGGTSNGVQNALAPALAIGPNKAVTFYGNIAQFGNGASISTTFFTTDNSSGAGLYVRSNTSPNISLGTADDVKLTRDAANTLALRNGTAAQAFRVYNTYTSATEFERGNIFWDSNALKIGTEKGSAGGTDRPIEFYTAGVKRLEILANGNVQAPNFVSTGALYWGSTSLLTNTRLRLSTPADGQVLLQDQAQTSFSLIMLGGTTSSFPALKRSSTTLQARLADDSAFASVQGKLTTETAYTAGAPTATGYLVVYDSNGTAYRIPAVLN